MWCIKVRCVNGGIEYPYVLKGRPVCTATSSKQPNFSGHSRGRKIHLAKDQKLTMCNMLIDKYIPASDQNYTMVKNGKCKNCFK